MGMGGSFSGSGSNLNELLQVIASQSGIAEKLKEFSDAKAEAEAVIALVGPAESIGALHAQAVTDRGAAAETLASARVEAERILVEARERASTLAGEASADRSAADLALRNAQAELDSAGAEAGRIVSEARASVANLREEAEKDSASIKAGLVGLAADRERCRLIEEQADAARRKFESMVLKTRAIWGI